jgi:hypothetical protein
MYIQNAYQPRLATKFGKGSRVYRSNNALTDDQIRTVAPSIFAEGQHESRSSRYSYVPTVEILSGLRREGFEPFMVAQGGARDEGKLGFTKHMLRLRHSSALSVQEETPEIILVNSHDGTTSYQLMAGVYRFVCHNGMICGDTLGEVRVRHQGDIVRNVIDGCISLVSSIPKVQDEVREFKALQLTEGERGAFATAALAAKYDEGEAPFKAEKLLTVRRRDDAPATLWNTLNTVQENVIQGGIGYLQETDRSRSYRRTREVKGIDQNVKVNRALWILAEEMRKIKAAA